MGTAHGLDLDGIRDEMESESFDNDGERDVRLVIDPDVERNEAWRVVAAEALGAMGYDLAQGEDGKWYAVECADE